MLGFHGRSKELRDLELIIENRLDSRRNILCITGEAGIGKTSIAYHLFQMYYSQSAFESAHAVSAYMVPWENLISQIARLLLEKIPSKATVLELRREILAYVGDNKTLLLLDYVDLTGGPLNDFVMEWAEAKSSFLMLTTRNIQNEQSLLSKCEIYKLDGIKEDWLVRELLGENLTRRVENFGIWRSLKILNDNPQKLLYLRWRSPEDKDRIIGCVTDLAKGAKEFDAVDSVLGRIMNDMPLEHFLALGRIRVPEIEEDFLAFLWDRLAMGGAEQCVMTIKRLLDEKLLEPTDRRKLRVNAHVHGQLQQACEMTLGPEQSSHIEYYIGTYFRKRFSRDKDTEFLIRDLENYVYHMIRSGNFSSAYAYVFESDVLEMAYRKGLSLELESILKLLDNSLQKKLSSPEESDEGSKSELTARAARVKLELGRVCKDLSKHKESLEYLDKTAELLESGSAGSSRELHRLRADVEHIRGVAFSQIGKTFKCLKSYLYSVSYATSYDCFEARDALSMGYLAYELKFHDIDEAQRTGRKAVDLAAEIGDKNVIAKNLCSLGQIQSFAGKIEESEKNFLAAEEYCRKDSGDIRELCRILINSAVTYIAGDRLDTAEQRLLQSAELGGDSGDRRRKSIADAYLAIIRYRQNQKTVAQDLILEAFKRHKEIGSVREVIYEALTFIWMKYNGKMPPLSDIINSDDLPQEIQNTVKDIINERHGVFAGFWENYYLPTLLNSRLQEKWL